jgi:hypothetical protein
MSAYRVEPEVVRVELPESRRPSFFGYGLGYGFLVYISGLPVLTLLSVVFPGVTIVAKNTDIGSFLFTMMIVGALVGVPFGLLLCWLRLSKAQEGYALECANNIAASTAEEANAILETCTRELSNIPNSLREAEAWVGQAKHEYSESAFTPFWEAVEGAAEQLALCSASARRLNMESNRYYELLSMKRHNFPLNPIRGPVPDPGATIAAFKAIVRKGQTNPQCAMFWELRATRHVIIAGFSSLGEAVNNVSFSLSTALEELSASLSRRR